MQPIIHTAKDKKFLLVQVPADQQNNKPYTQHFPRAGSWLAFESDNLNDFKTQIPEGQWEIIGKASELSEEQAATIVLMIGGKIDDCPVFKDYVNLEQDNGYGYPHNSLLSLCNSLNINPNECLILKEK